MNIKCKKLIILTSFKYNLTNVSEVIRNIIEQYPGYKVMTMPEIYKPLKQRYEIGNDIINKINSGNRIILITYSDEILQMLSNGIKRHYIIKSNLYYNQCINCKLSLNPDDIECYVYNGNEFEEITIDNVYGTFDISDLKDVHLNVYYETEQLRSLIENE